MLLQILEIRQKSGYVNGIAGSILRRSMRKFWEDKEMKDEDIVG